MRTHIILVGLAAVLVSVYPGAATKEADPDGQSLEASPELLASAILSDTNLTVVLDRAQGLLRTGLNAGSGYGEVWIRDLNTFVELGLEVADRGLIREALLRFFAFQGPEGDIVDGFIPKEKANVNYEYRVSPLAPGFLAHKNTVETDQESSLVQAIGKYVRVTGDRTLLTERVAGKSVGERMAWALDYVHAARFDEEHGLVWGATTADWGDVQPEHEWGVELDERSHRALDIYDNAMFLIAVDDLLSLGIADAEATARWREVAAGVRRSVREHLWDATRGKFIPHIYLEGSPFPEAFDERAVHYHGGTAVAIEAGLLSREEVREVLGQMRENVRRAGASSIGLTVYPVYPAGTFKNPSMGPYSYQNGGDWCWFGGRMIQQLIRYGFIEEAYAELRPMVERVVEHEGFYEWWSLDNQPRGSGLFRGSAGVLGVAIRQLQRWAEGVAPRGSFVPGALWLDDRGEHINAHGGGVLPHEGVYYWFGEHKTEGRRGNRANVGVRCYASRDLVHWTNEGVALAVVDDSTSDLVRGCVLERPKVIYNARTGKFVMWFHLELRGQGYRSARTGVAVADEVAGPYRFLRSGRVNPGVWPEDYEPANRSAEGEVESEDPADDSVLRRDFAGGQMARDMTLFVDDDGKAYHLHASEENRTLHLCELSDDYLTFTGRYRRLFPGRYHEAPALFKRQGRYYLITSGCTGWDPNAARSAVADSIWGPWTELGNPCVGVNPSNGLGPEKTFGGQSTYVLPVADRPGVYIAMFDEWRPQNAIGGRYYWLPIEFAEGGFQVRWRDRWALGD